MSYVDSFDGTYCSECAYKLEKVDRPSCLKRDWDYTIGLEVQSILDREKED